METQNTLLKGTVLNGSSYSYLIERILGQGSFGITYLASVKMAGALGSIDAKIKVAIKEFFMRDINGRVESTVTSGNKGGLYDEYKRKFKREALNLSKLQHEHIIKVIESFEANNTVYYVMEYMEGGSLDDYIARNQGLKEEEAVQIVKQIGSALSFMHSQGFLHLDLKPSNIMRKESGEVVLIDFGLSKQYGSDGNPESSTKVGAGTPGYAPIEQANYREGNGFPVTMDVYALGATMFKMLTGVRPPEASEILNEGFPFDELQSRKVSNRTIACVARAMAPIKKDRYQTVAEFLNAIDSDETIVVDVQIADSQDAEKTQIVEVEIVKPKKPEPPKQPEIAKHLNPAEVKQPSKPKSKKWLWALLIAVLVAVATFLVIGFLNKPKDPVDQAIDWLKDVVAQIEVAESIDEINEIIDNSDEKINEIAKELENYQLTDEQEKELQYYFTELESTYKSKMKEIGYELDENGNIVGTDSIGAYAEEDPSYDWAEADSTVYY